ncbi:hypothetical protein ACFQ61_09920 [Streptomyces sp. NPDC056500]|uniref:hypothetical protein n=1 Tax=Streptomyces sp. NPDC056500 TaxID=3345840 RepID=UPI003679F169
MRRGLVHAIAWSLATGASVTLSWWGVHTVMSGTVYDRPRALPINADTPTTQGSKPQVSSSGQPPEDKAEPSSHDRPDEPTRDDPEPPYEHARETSEEVTPPSETTTPSESFKPPTSPSSSEPPRRAEVYPRDGGKVIFDIGPTSATLASARPKAGWKMEVHEDTHWIRVVFTKDDRESSVFCRWETGTPSVEFYDK